MTRRGLIVGQAPARSAGPDTRPWDSASGKRLATMMGTDLETLLETFDTTNLNEELAGTNGKWDLFDETVAEHKAAYLRRSILSEYDVVLACGARVAKALGFPCPGGRWDVRAETWTFGVPHPGGTNMWWNDPNHRAKGTAVVRSAWELVNSAGG